tara:strand:+ start:2316 stop:3218 length:903 start_codon:yes stop_codon:yes gene_type:complete
MKKVCRVNQIIFIILITLSFAIAGYVYNKKQTSSFYVKYSISLTDKAKVYIRAMDTLLSGLEFGNNVLLSFIDQKIVKQTVLNENPYFKDLYIDSQQIIFKTNGSIKNLDEKIKKLLVTLNTNLRIEVIDFIRTADDVNKATSAISKDLRLKDLDFSLKFYEKNSGQPIPVIDDAFEIVEYLYSRSDNTLTEEELLSSLMKELKKIKEATSSKFLKLEFEKLKAFGTNQRLTFMKIDKLSKNISEIDIIELNGLRELTSLKTELLVSVISFSIFGFSISLMILLINLIFSKKINIKKLLI